MDKEYKPLVDEALIQLKLIIKSAILAPEIIEQAKEIITIITGKAKKSGNSIKIQNIDELLISGFDLESSPEGVLISPFDAQTFTWTVTQSGTVPSGTALREAQEATRFVTTNTEIPF